VWLVDFNFLDHFIALMIYILENVDTIRPKAAVKLYQRSRKATQKTDPMSKLELNGPNVARQIEENRQDEEENEPPPLLTQGDLYKY
jgi:hypothetical protein